MRIRLAANFLLTGQNVDGYGKAKDIREIDDWDKEPCGESNLNDEAGLMKTPNPQRKKLRRNMLLDVVDLTPRELGSAGKAHISSAWPLNEKAISEQNSQLPLVAEEKRTTYVINSLK